MSNLSPPHHKLRISKPELWPLARCPFPTLYPPRLPVCTPRLHARSGSAQGFQEPSTQLLGKSTASRDAPKVGLGKAAGMGSGVGGPVSPHVILHSWRELAQGRRKRGDGACVLALAWEQREKEGESLLSYLATGLRGGQPGTGLSVVAPLHADRRGPLREARGNVGRSGLQFWAGFRPPGAFKEKLAANPSPDPRSPRRRPPI